MRWTPQKKHVLAALAEEIVHNYGRGRVIVAIDGVDGAGKTHFAADLAEAMRLTGHAVVQASIDGFHRPRAQRYERGRDSARGFYEDSYDYSLFRRVLIDPFRAPSSGAFVTEAFDHERDSPIEPKWITAPDDAILIVDGIFLNRPELRGLWNFSIWLAVAPAVAHARMRERDGNTTIAARYVDGQKLYAHEAKPSAAATAIVDNDDFDHPRRVFADSC
ncbi:MAG: uridine kinase [Microbacteriaceae bacterium]